VKNTIKYGKKADIALGLWVKLARAFSTFNKLSSANIKSFGLTEPQFSLLECLGHLGPLTIGELSKKMLVSSGNTTVVLDNLEKNGLTERVHSKEDRRTIITKLTPKGKKLFDDIFSSHANFIVNSTSVLSEQEQITLSQLLKKLGVSLNEKNPTTNNKLIDGK
jgi:MarR family transcriptional regulator, 2-MHQ and catechol-resistance regulon repressor